MKDSEYGEEESVQCVKSRFQHITGNITVFAESHVLSGASVLEQKSGISQYIRAVYLIELGKFSCNHKSH